MEIKDKVVLITGSSHGIGAATAKEFAKAGSKVIVTYNTDKLAGEKVAQECRESSEAMLVYLDVTDIKSMNKAISEIEEKFGHLDILINNAGVAVQKYFVDQSMDEINNQLDVNLKGLINITHAALPIILKQKEGLIINIASGLGKQGSAIYSVYCASKFGVRGFTQSLAQELPNHVRTYVVNPAGTATRMTGYTGNDPKDVAKVILAAAQESLNKNSGEDIDVWEYI
jgi:3-oxoacyl-[acyl-carrier protein] reductase